MTAIETIALIFIIVVAIKILVIAISPKSWIKFAKNIWKFQGLSIIYLVLAFVVFYFLVQELTIVKILAVTAFVALLMGTQLARYSKEIMEFAQKMSKNKKEVWAKNWLYILIWIILLVLGLMELLA